MLTMNSVKILHAVRSASTATAELLVCKRLRNTLTYLLTTVTTDFSRTNLLQTCRLCCGLVAEVTNLLWTSYGETDVMDFGIYWCLCHYMCLIIMVIRVKGRDIYAAHYYHRLQGNWNSSGEVAY